MKSGSNWRRMRRRRTCLFTHWIAVVAVLVSSQMPQVANGQQPDADSTARDQALVAAVEAGNLDQSVNLLSQGASADVRASNGLPILYIAAQSGQHDLLRRLIEAGADVEASPTTTPGFTSLGVAAQLGDSDTVAALLAAGANTDVRSPSGSTPLIVAAQYDRNNVIELLLSAGAKVDAVRDDGMTAISLAAEREFPDV